MTKSIYIHREIETTIKKILPHFPAIALTGPRQSGKSTVLKNLFAKTHQFYSFDDPLIRQQAISDPRLFLSNLEEPMVLDEIQYVPELISYLKIAIDKDRNKKGRFIITGSQQFHLIKNLGDSLAGRVGLLSLLFFSLKEKSSLLRKASPEEFFIDACLRGSYPELTVDPKIDFESWYGSYLQTYLERDIRTIYEIGSLREFQRFIQLLAVRCAQILNLNSLSAELGVTSNTIKKWLSILEASQIIYLLSPYYQNLGKRITKNPKVYFTDCGLVCYLIGIRQRDQLFSSAFIGPLFENYVIQETVKSFLNQGIEPRLYYLRTHNGLEIDLLIENKGKISPIEIKSSKTLSLEDAKSIKKFSELFAKLPIERGKVISLADQELKLSFNVQSQQINTFLKEIKKN